MTEAHLRPAARTDMQVLPATAEVRAADGYTVIRTPDRPDFWFGNYLLLHRPPAAGEGARWRQVWEREFASAPLVGQLVLQWETALDAAGGAEAEIAAALGGSAGRDAVFLADALPPRPAPAGMHVARITTAAEWEEAVRLTVEETAEPTAEWLDFWRWRYAAWARRVEQDAGGWWGARASGELVAVAGVIAADGWARLQEVVTRVPFQRRGAAAALVSAAAADAMRLPGIGRCVAVANAESPAEALYASLGFRQVGWQFSVTAPR